MDFVSLASSLQPDTSFTFTATVIIAGLSVVLATLALLVIVFMGFGSAVSKTQKKSGKNDADNLPAPAPKKQNSVSQNTVNGEIVAAISAAIYAIEGENAVITSIAPAKVVVKRTSPVKCRNPWAQAAVIDNNKAF